MFAVVHPRGLSYPLRDCVVLAAGFATVLEAARARLVSGDLVVDMNTRRVVGNSLWFWPWERKDPNCYAQRARRQWR